MKIFVVGYSGAGKTVFTEGLAKSLQCPVMHIDDLLYTHNFDARDSSGAVEIVEKVVRENVSWVMDGYRDTFVKHEWLESADYIVFLDFSRIICIWHVMKRTCQRAVNEIWHSRVNKVQVENVNFEGRNTDESNVDEKSAKIESNGTIWKLEKVIRSF